MTTAARVLVVAAVIVAVADWYAVGTHRRRAEYVLKPLVMVLLVGVACTVDATSGAARAWFVAALLLSLAGDVALMLPRQAFVVGLGAFLLAHLAYVVGLLVLVEPSPSWAAAGLGVVLAVDAAVAPRLLRSVHADHRSLVVPVALYLLAISVMVVTAWGTALPVAALGATAFLASDSMLGWDRFVRSWSWARPAVMATYHLGQLGLVLALAA